MHDTTLIFTIAGAFAAAWVLGLLTQKLRLSPIVGYLLAGVLIGPYTPGFHADAGLATQLAEIGVSLLMFGVGLHFNLKDLLAVRDIAIPGALGQSLIATLLGAVAAMALGWSFQGGLVLGMAMAVASTVVLMRVLMDNHKLDTSEGHIAVGWLVVEDILTVLLLVILPAMGGAAASGVVGADGQTAEHVQSLWVALPLAIAKLGVMMAILLVAGSRVVPWIMVKVAKLRSRELFTLTVLVMAITVAAACQVVFGASMALGAFLAGMVVGRSEVSHQAAADALPLRDAFAVLFFCSVGMLFDPMFIINQPMMMLMGLVIVLICKPLAALAIVAIVGYPVRTGLTVAIGLAQIGEFSFILSGLAEHYKLLPSDGHHLLVGCAIVSITLNPILFRSLPAIERWLKGYGTIWRILNYKADHRQTRLNASAMQAIETTEKPLAVVLGYGPVGRTVDAILRASMDTVVVDLNLDTVQRVKHEGRLAIYGDASNIEVMDQAIAKATHLVITLPHSLDRAHMIGAAKLLNPSIKVFVRARYIGEREELEQVGADGICYEEAEAAVGLVKLVMFDQGASSEAIQRETHRIRQNAYGDGYFK